MAEVDIAIPRSQTDDHCVTFIDFLPKYSVYKSAQISFETFDTLLPKANAWLTEHPKVEILKCETLEQKVADVKYLGSYSVKFDVPDQTKDVYLVKGLRLWYTTEIPILPGCAKPRSHAQQIGYRNFVPSCTDFSHKYPVFEHLSGMYMNMNEELLEKPLAGKIISVETVPFKVSRSTWQGPEVELERSEWLDSPTYHILYVTRIFYISECPAYEQIGAADFLPDSIDDKYQSFQSIFVKINSWLQNVKKVNTSLNFLVKADTLPTVNFLRVAYVRPKYGLPPGGLHAPKNLFYKTVIPKIDSSPESSTVEFEDELTMWTKIVSWMKESHMTYQHLVSVELVYHPMTLLVKKKDQGETTFIKGTWVFPSPMDGKESGVHRDDMVRLPLVKIFRLYFDSSPVIKVKRNRNNSHQRKSNSHISDRTSTIDKQERTSTINKPERNLTTCDQERNSSQAVQIPATPQTPNGTCFPFVCKK